MGFIVPAVNNLYVSLPQVISSYNDFMSIIEKLNIASVCTGNPDQHLVETVQKRLENPTCSIPAYMDSTLTVRHKDCFILLLIHKRNAVFVITIGTI